MHEMEPKFSQPAVTFQLREWMQKRMILNDLLFFAHSELRLRLASVWMPSSAETVILLMFWGFFLVFLKTKERRGCLQSSAFI